MKRRRCWMLTALGAVLGVVCAWLLAGLGAESSPGDVSRASPTAGAESAAHRGAPKFESVVIGNVPHLRQKPDFCGEACAAMWLRKLGITVDQDYVFDHSGLSPLLARGCHTRELAVVLERIGFITGRIWYPLPETERTGELEKRWAALHADLMRGVPSIVCMHYDGSPQAAEHFRLLLGYDARSDEVIYHEPAVERGAYLRMAREEFLKLWPLPARGGGEMLVRLRLEARPALRAGKYPAPSGERHTPADFAQHMMRLRRKVPQGFTVVVQPPFVVIGDEPPATVRRRAERTVKWAVDKLKAAYFKDDPKSIIDIWLFKDKASYEKHCRELFATRPTTPYGFFSRADHALVMNIATGGGTLVHEIVHPFVEANFPACPAWFNEGLGSLYEQSAERNGRIVGLTNWRLRGLQEAVRKDQLPSFRELCTTTTSEFYYEDKGTNYAQARYLCYYLQEAGLLEKYYHAFRAAHQKDPSGYETLKAVLQRDEEGMKQFQKQWEAWILRLEFP